MKMRAIGEQSAFPVTAHLQPPYFAFRKIESNIAASSVHAPEFFGFSETNKAHKRFNSEVLAYDILHGREKLELFS